MSRSCSSCEVVISPERLKALPNARQCAVCLAMNGDVATLTDNYVPPTFEVVDVPVPADEEELTKDQEYELEEVGFVSK
jgi:hypothetical protein